MWFYFFKPFMIYFVIVWYLIVQCNAMGCDPLCPLIVSCSWHLYWGGLFSPPIHQLLFHVWACIEERSPCGWSDWNESFLLWLVMASSQKMWSSLTLDRVEAVWRPARQSEAAGGGCQRPSEATMPVSLAHPSIFISLLYTGLVHTTPPFKMVSTFCPS